MLLVVNQLMTQLLGFLQITSDDLLTYFCDLYVEVTILNLLEGLDFLYGILNLLFVVE